MRKAFCTTWKIFDREGNPVVDNKSLRTITYTR